VSQIAVVGDKAHACAKEMQIIEIGTRALMMTLWRSRRIQMLDRAAAACGKIIYD
jgi:hypothetical protein